MAASSNTSLYIRKLRKKLRQIENLERLDRSLSEDERLKVSKKDYIRETLLQCLETYSEELEGTGQPEADTSYGTDWSSFSQPTHSAAAVDEDKESDDKTEVGRPERRLEPTVDLLTEDMKHPHDESDLSGQGDHADVSPSKIPRKEKKTKVQCQREMSHRCQSAKKLWTNACFEVTLMEGHEDMVTSVDMDEDYMVTASRDTTVKIWDMKTLTELRSLGGHGLTVTSVHLLSLEESQGIAPHIHCERDDRVVLSGSLDCSFKFWSVKTGYIYESIYTFAPITKLLYMPDKCMVLTGTGGGKLELFDMKKPEDPQESIQQLNAHEEAVTGLCMSSGLINSSCGEGDICVFELREDRLHLLWANESVHLTNGTCVKNRHTRALAGYGPNIYYGDDGINIKSLLWKKALVKKIRNHSGEVGVTDALCINDGLLISSAYDLDTGYGYLNVHWVPEEEYLATVNDEDSDRIICVGCTVSKNELVTIATGGIQLKVWKMMPASEKKEADEDEDIVQTSFITELAQSPVDSDIESDIEFSESDEDALEPGRGSNSSQKQPGWFSWCTVL